MKVKLLLSLLLVSARLLSVVQAQAPSSWFCPDADYNDGRNCDCNCGASDPDCDDDENRVIDCDTAEICVVGGCQLDIPVKWTNCPSNNFASRDGCHCECGAFDPDCIDPSASVFFCDDGVCDAEGKCQRPLSRGAVFGIITGSVFGAFFLACMLAAMVQKRMVRGLQQSEENMSNGIGHRLGSSTQSEEDLTPTATMLAAHELDSTDNIPQATIDSPFGDLGRHNINQDSL